MGYQGVNSLDPGEALNVQLARLGFDEVDFTEHLTNGATVASAEWSVTNDLKNADGATSLTVTDVADSNLAAFFVGELLDALQVLKPLRNRDMSAGVNWVSHDLTTFSAAGQWLRTDANTAGMYWKIDPAYAPMIAGHTYKMTVKTNGQTWQGTGWEFKDAGGRRLESSTVPGTYFQVLSDPGTGGQIFTFTAPTGTSGGFNVVALSDKCDVFYWDNFELVDTAADAVAIGLVFKVTGTGDTTDNALENAKGSAPAANDLFAVTNITTEEVVYIGNAIGSYAWSAASTTSTLIQTAANRASAGINAKGKNLKEYKLTYTIAEAYQRAKNFATCVNGDYGTFDGASATGFHAVSDGSTSHEGGTADEIVVKNGKVYTVSFTLVLTSGTAPTINLLTALNGTALSDEGATASADGSNTLTFTASASGTGVVQFQNVSTATEYTVSSLKVYENTRLPDGTFALTLETFAKESTTMPFAEGAQTVYFLSASDADAADFAITATSGTATEGVFGISALTLFRCCDNDTNADGVAWWRIRAFKGAATASGTAMYGDDLSSDELAEHQTIEGAWSRIEGTAGIILAYRVPYRSTDV